MTAIDELQPEISQLCDKKDVIKLSYTKESLGLLTNKALKDILTTFRKKKTGSKEVLVGRILAAAACVGTGSTSVHSHHCIDFFAVDNKKSWVRDLKLVPNLTLRQLTNYFEHDKRTYDCSSRKDRNNLEKATSLFHSKYVSDLKVCTTKRTIGLHAEDVEPEQDELIVIIRGMCKASMKSTSYEVFAAILQDGSIECASCKCTAGKGESCCHVGAILLAIVELRARGCTTIPNDDSCTSKLSQWNVPGNRTSVKKDIPLDKVLIAKPSTSHPLRPIKRVITHDIKPNMEKRTKMIQLYRSVYPTCPAARYAPVPCNFHQKSGPTVMKDIMTEYELAPSHCVDVVDEQIIFDKTDVIMEKLFRKETLYDTTETELDLAIKEYTSKNIDNILSSTADQSSSKCWHRERSIRLTSSNFGMILGYKGKKEPLSHIKTLMGYYGPLQRKCLAHGQDFEPLARRCYVKETGRDVTLCGLMISKDHHFLAASPDGLITSRVVDGENGLLEIKCPYCLKEQPLESGHRDATLVDIAANLPSFCIKDGNDVKLKESHKYYAQVQGQMGIAGRKWCDFVVFTGHKTHGIHIQRIPFNRIYWEDLCRKLEQFYYKFCLKELKSREIMHGMHTKEEE